jgi:hypothetical protein
VFPPGIKIHSTICEGTGSFSKKEIDFAFPLERERERDRERERETRKATDGLLF